MILQLITLFCTQIKNTFEKQAQNLYFFRHLNISPSTLAFTCPTVHENDGSQPTQPLLCLVPGVCLLPFDDHLHPHNGAEVRRHPSQKWRLPSFPVPLRLRLKHPCLQLPGQLLLWQDLHCRSEWQPYIHPLLLPLHCGHGRGDESHILPEERPGEEPTLSWLKTAWNNQNCNLLWNTEGAIMLFLSPICYLLPPSKTMLRVEIY